MKYLAFILSIYILTLNFIGCEDATSIDNQARTTISQNAENEHQDLDFCSPFCTCQCCQINVTPLRLTIISIPVPPISAFSKPIFFYQKGNECGFLADSFKPPIV